MTDEDILLEGSTEGFGAGVIGVCDICKSRQAVIVLSKERFKLCVLDFLNKSWIKTTAAPAAHSPPFDHTTEFVACRSVIGGKVPVVVLSPKKEVKRPSALVVPEVYGITTQVIETGVRLAHEGYEVAIPDFARVHGVNLWSWAKMRSSKVLWDQVHVSLSRRERSLRILETVRKYVLTRPLVTPERQMVVGLSYGGTWALAYAAQCPSISGVAVAYPYMPHPSSYLQYLRCPVFVVAGGDDAKAGPSIHELHQVAHRYGVNLGTMIVPGVGHHFLSRDHRPYHEKEAELAWSRMMAFVNHCLSPPPAKTPVRPPVPPPAASVAKPAVAVAATPSAVPRPTTPPGPAGPSVAPALGTGGPASR